MIRTYPMTSYSRLSDAMTTARSKRRLMPLLRLILNLSSLKSRPIVAPPFVWLYGLRSH